MKKIKLSFIINSLIKISVIIALIIAASTKQEYSYYNFIRWLVMFTSTYFIGRMVLDLEKKSQVAFVYFYAIVFVLYEPFSEKEYQKETWQIIDYLVSTIILITIGYEAYYDIKA